jgi:predicted helicase
MLKSYFKKIFEVGKTGDAREESYYSTLEDLLKIYGDSIEKKKFHITTLPKKTEAGNPDFRVWDGKQHIVGYIEAKAPTIDYLDQIETTDQLKRYLHIFPNLILTNFFEFRLYRDGSLIDRVSISRPFLLHKLKTTPLVENEANFLKLLERFFSFSLPKVYDAKTLAIELAKRTRFLRDEVVMQELKEEESLGKGFISGFYEAFRQYLIRGLSKEEFADLYSQTITYGLFAARTRSENGFNRKLAYDNIPRTIGILRDVFKFISLEDLPQQMEWIIDDISEVLAVTDVRNILHQYFHEGKGKDPIVHFYETFLAEYDPKTREKRGVYYTPESVVSYIVRSLHNILKNHFNRQDGFANDTVTVLDPAAGTLTFLAEASKLAVEEFVSKYGEGGKENFIKEQILKNFYAFELMMAPYAVGHLKMSFLLEELGYMLKKDDRFKLYLTNTLEMEELAQTELPGMVSLSEESHLAGRVKREQPILVILGNPPYSGMSANKGKWIDDLLKKGYIRADGLKDGGYYQVDGNPLREKNPKWLQDDYVKFIRFAQWKIDQAGEGILGFITNHSYLDNPTFRGMRQSLVNSFNEIYILDLHGSSLKKEKCPDGSKDQNVFDIRQGVAIALFIRRKSDKKGSESQDVSVTLSEAKGLFPTNKNIDSSASPQNDKHTGCEVFHSEIWGLRKKKYDWLSENDIKTAKWNKLSPKSEFYLFIPRDEKLSEAYEKYLKITDIFPVNSVGIVTARDNLTIRWTSEEIWQTVLNFSKLEIEMARMAYDLGKDVRDWKVEFAQNDLKESGLERKKIVAILYRPFDTRYTYYTGKSRGFLCMPRPEVMRHMMQENLGLITARSNKSKQMNHFFCTRNIMETKCGESTTQSCLFPLYLYSDDLFSHRKVTEKKETNIKQQILETLADIYGKKPTPEEMFYYIYTILYSDIYRKKYAEFLRIDFPRIPFTKDYKLFCKMGEYGKTLVDLHLLKSNELDKPIAKFQGKEANKVEKVKYEQGRAWINNEQYFDGISPEVWQYQIGGYQVCDKWLKDRKGRVLSLDDIRHYCKVVTSIGKTIEVQKAIDEVFSEVEKETIDFKL